MLKPGWHGADGRVCVRVGEKGNGWSCARRKKQIVNRANPYITYYRQAAGASFCRLHSRVSYAHNAEILIAQAFNLYSPPLARQYRIP